VIYAITSPKTILINFWRVGPMNIAILIPKILLARKPYPSGEEPT
jgi:hypothetical protein